MRTDLKHISFEWDEEYKRLTIFVDNQRMVIPYRNLYSLKVFLNRIYRKYLNAGIAYKRKKK